MAEPADEGPPQPPPFQRRIKVDRSQLIGVGALCVIVIAALAGLLGLRPATASASAGALQVQVRYPQILRYKTSLPLAISVRNTGSSALARVAVQVDRGYLEAFQDVQFTPAAQELSDRHYQVLLRDLSAGETRQVVASLEALQLGRRAAHVRVNADNTPGLDLNWSTTVLP
jgi:hypothetical protein